MGNNGDAFLGQSTTALGSLAEEEIAQILSQTSCLLVPSLAENSPLVIAEAAARGTASIVNSVGGMPDMVASFEAGRVFSHRADLCESMAHVAPRDGHTSPDSRDALSARAITLFSPARVSQQYDDLYSV